MIGNREHYISHSIRLVYFKRLIAPFLYLIALAVLWFSLSLTNLIFPKEISSYDEIIKSYYGNDEHVHITLNDLHFTGYTNTRLGQNIGYFYYTMLDDHCVFVLLTPHTCDEGLPYLERATVTAQLQLGGGKYQTLTELLSKDLNWTSGGLREKASPYMLNEPDSRSVPGSILILAYLFSGFCALISVIMNLIYILFPTVSPPCRSLRHYGKVADMLQEAEEELATLPQLATEDMFITEHYFIEIAQSGIAIVPIKEIVWMYKYSTLHKLFKYVFNISYTLHLTTSKGHYIRCPKNIKSDIDGIIDYLSEANHNILVGFNEENRLKVLSMQKHTLKIEKLIKFMKKRL